MAMLWLWLCLCALCVCMCACLCVGVCVLWLQCRRTRHLLSHLPQLPTLPLLGNIHQLIGDGAFLFKTLERVTAISERSGQPFACWIGPRAAILVNDPEDVKAITNAFVEKPYYYGFARDWVGDGLVTAPGDVWKRNIKRLSGTFSGGVVGGYQDVFDANAALLVSRLASVSDRPVDLFQYLSYTTLESICQTALGVPSASQCIASHDYHCALSRTLELLTLRAQNILYHVDWLYRLSGQHRELQRCIRVLHTVSHTIMGKRMQERHAMRTNGRLDNEINDRKSGTNRFKSFLDILLEMAETDGSMTPQQIGWEIDTIIFGGQETVSTTLLMLLLVVGSEPSVQKKMADELFEIFGSSRRAVTKDDLVRMRYCEAVIQETLRLFPPMPVLLRDADRDLDIKSCTVPKGVTCGVNAWAAGRSRRTWGPDALVFAPERWLEAPGGLDPATFLAFSYGRRACIGKRYAYAIMKTILAHVMREFEVTADIDGVSFEVDVSLKAVSGHLIALRPRVRERDP